jgi:hypothetical protein
MKRLEINDEDYSRLESLGTDWYVVKGTTPMAPEKIVHRLIEDKWESAHPREYRSTIGREG